MNTQRLLDSMALLCQDPKFQVFMEEIGSMKDQAVRDMIGDDVISDPLKSAASRGEIRAYVSILDAHVNFLQNVSQIALESRGN